MIFILKVLRAVKLPLLIDSF